MRTEDWFLAGSERGNRVVAHVHGAAYFARLVEEVRQLERGDHLFFTDWRGDADERLCADGPTVGELFCAAARRGVLVKGLMWRSHRDELSYSEEQNRQLGDEVSAAGGEVLLDQRVRRAGSHHQKLVVLRRPGAPERDVAFAGGIDLCHSRRDDAAHAGDPQAVPMARAYGDRPPWHDVQLEVRGPAVGLLDEVFRERWEDPIRSTRTTRSRTCGTGCSGPTSSPTRYPDARRTRRPRDLRPCRSCALIRPSGHPAGLPLRPARRAVGGPRVREGPAPGAAAGLPRGPVHVVAPHRRAARRRPAPQPRAAPGRGRARHPDVDGGFALPPNQVGRLQAIEVCHRAAPDRVDVYGLENHQGTPVYVHAKVAVLDAGFARGLRLELLREHLDREPGDDADLVDPAGAVHAVEAAATALDAWHDSGRTGPRPAGRLRRHRPERMSRLTRSWAVPAYRALYDPDGRPWRDRLRHRW